MLLFKMSRFSTQIRANTELVANGNREAKHRHSSTAFLNLAQFSCITAVNAQMNECNKGMH